MLTKQRNILKRFEALIKEYTVPAICVFLTYVLLHVLKTGCPVKYLTGISCPGCGMFRAYCHVITLDLKGAFALHPLWPMPILWIIVFAFRDRINAKIYKLINLLFIAALIIVYIVRLSTGNDPVVVFDPQSGYLYRTIQKFF
ncbi:MAG: DUF2752 domain-containing protein [Lachnospiraceae bacterium]|nr:DUF2752 domain-containing protein [Lachnospiraceae bacterium]